MSPTDSEQLGQILTRLTRMETKFDDALERLECHDTSIYGDGSSHRVGINTRLDRVERTVKDMKQTERTIKGSIAAAVVSVIGALVTSIVTLIWGAQK